MTKNEFKILHGFSDLDMENIELLCESKPERIVSILTLQEKEARDLQEIKNNCNWTFRR